MTDKEKELQAEAIDYLRKQIAELKSDNDARKFAMAMSEKVEKQLREQLTNAKEIIKSLLETPRTVYKRDREGEVVPFENMAYARLKEEAEQFLKNDSCPDVMCEDCTKEDCGIKKLGLAKVEK